MSFDGKKILVTGGAGFVGSNITASLIAQGAKVTVLDDLFTGSADNLPVHEDCDFVEGSVCDLDVVRKLMANAELVVHAAARNIIISMKDPRNDFDTNIGGTLNILMAAKDAPVTRIVYTSSASVYGNPRYLPVNEDDRLRSLTPYSVSKLAAEHYCSAFYDSYGVPVATVRYSNVYGPNQHPSNPYCGVVGKFIHAALNGEQPKIHGDGEHTRDYTYVDDAVAATVAALGNPRAEGEIFNVGTGTETTVNKLCSTILSLTGSEVVPEHLERRDIDNIRRRVLNIEKARRVLRWHPTYTLSRGLKNTIDWYKAQR